MDTQWEWTGSHLSTKHDRKSKHDYYKVNFTEHSPGKQYVLNKYFMKNWLNDKYTLSAYYHIVYEMLLRFWSSFSLSKILLPFNFIEKNNKGIATNLAEKKWMKIVSF